MISEKLDKIKTSAEMFEFVRNNEVLYWGVEFQNEEYIVYDLVYEENDITYNRKLKLKKSFWLRTSLD